MMNWMCFMAVTVLVDLASVASLRNPSAMARGYGRDRPVNPLTIYLTPQFIPAGTLSAEADTTSEVRVESYDKASGSGSSGRASPSNRFFGSLSSGSSTSGNRHRPSANRPPFGRPPALTSNRPAFSSTSSIRPPLSSFPVTASSTNRPPLSSSSGSVSSSSPPLSFASSSSSSSSSSLPSSSLPSSSLPSSSPPLVVSISGSSSSSSSASSNLPLFGSSSGSSASSSLPPSSGASSSGVSSSGSSSATSSSSSSSSSSGASAPSANASSGSSSASQASSTSSSADCGGSSGMVMMGGEIPGTADIDYPVLSSVPETSFSCRDQQIGGYYADVEARCQVFHVCHDYRKSSFLCPNGTLFDQQNFVCNWYFNVNCANSARYFSLNANIGIVPERSDPPLDDPFQSASSVQQPNTVLQYKVEQLETDLLPPPLSDNDDFFDYSYLPPL